jgi:hypothetical protein
MKSDGNYYVNIPYKSKYANKLGYGEKSYGNNKEKANEIYKMNFPDCPIPLILQFGPTRDCPFIIRKANPCYETECRNVDWKQDDPSKMGLNAQCRKHVSHYCHLNKGLDPNCDCWLENNVKSETCQKFRRHFEPPEDYGFNVNIFEISEHPDYKNYIRKDKIPCWNCNLDAPTVEDNNVSRTWLNN